MPPRRLHPVLPKQAGASVGSPDGRYTLPAPCFPCQSATEPFVAITVAVVVEDVADLLRRRAARLSTCSEAAQGVS